MPRHSRLASLRMPAAARNAAKLRPAMTDAERKLWHSLRRNNLDGWYFRRQVPIAEFIVDFLCEEARVVVEIDGGQHDERRERDELRTWALERRGYTVIRFWNNEVFGNLDGVLQAISEALVRRRA